MRQRIVIRRIERMVGTRQLTQPGRPRRPDSAMGTLRLSVI
jgi:hypothetical protein